LATGAEAKKSRVLSGMRPTGRLHIGHYFGALQNWVRLQNDPAYDCFYFIADWHALTSDYADTSAVAENTLQIMIDYLAAGLDPQKSVLFQQSVIPEHAELHLLLSMVTPLGWLERVPTYKEALENVKDKDLHNYGFLGYPILQCADIVIYGEPDARLIVPVGEDQVSHVEISREIVRRFNVFYGFELDEDLRKKNRASVWGSFYLSLGIPGNTPSLLDFPLNAEKWAEFSSRVRTRVLEVGIENALERLKVGIVHDMVKAASVLREPDAMLTKTPRIPGLDGRKMSKSYGNTITLSEPDEEIRKKTKVMVTDPARKRRTDPGNPDVCPVYDWHKLFSAEEPGRLEWVQTGCRTAGIGCIECKAAMAENLIKWIAPVRERRVQYENNPKRVLEVLDDGSNRARKVAQGTMERVREAVFGWNKKRAEIAGGGKQAASGE
jgi:tryptophanyl-tRNA synthetase